MWGILLSTLNLGETVANIIPFGTATIVSNTRI